MPTTSASNVSVAAAGEIDVVAMTAANAAPSESISFASTPFAALRESTPLRDMT